MPKTEKKERNVTPLPTEPKARFVALADKRVNAALGAIALVGKIARSKVEYTETEISAIETAIHDAWIAAKGELKAKLAGNAPAAKSSFSMTAAVAETSNVEGS